jgi:hypothetical protein
MSRSKDSNVGLRVQAFLEDVANASGDALVLIKAVLAQLLELKFLADVESVSAWRLRLYREPHASTWQNKLLHEAHSGKFLKAPKLDDPEMSYLLSGSSDKDVSGVTDLKHWL